MATALEQLRYIDEQLATAVLPQDQAELVRVHRLTGLQLRTQKMQGKELPLPEQQIDVLFSGNNSFRSQSSHFGKAYTV